MDKKIVTIAKRYAETVRNKMPARMVVLYGSHATGKAGADSDIDIAVVMDKAPDDYLKTSADLFNLVREVDKRIEPVLVVKNNDKSGFLESILKRGNVVYKAKRSGKSK